MTEGDRTNNDAADAGTSGVEGITQGGGDAPTSGSEAAGNDPASLDASGVGDTQQGGGGEGGGRDSGEGGGEGGGESGGQSSRAGDWNPGEYSGGGGELY